MSLLSIRFKEPTTHVRLRRCAENKSESMSGAAERLIEEGIRMQDHPGIVFRDGPTGRRAGLADGGDVWEMASVLRGLSGPLEERIISAAELTGATLRQIQIASRYYAEFSEEIDGRIDRNNSESERLYALSVKERAGHQARKRQGRIKTS